MTSPPQRSGTRLVLIALAAALIVGALVVGLGVVWLLRNRSFGPSFSGEQCMARSGEQATAITRDQAWWTSIIVGTSVKRKLVPRAASIAMATVYQETGIRNLDYGDRDSVGLFQQRPSQGWGTVEEIMDPYYSTGKFYDELVKVEDWQTGDINDVAQAVQRSGYPEAYRDHVADGRALATAFTGQTPAAFSCRYRITTTDRAGLNAFLVKTLGVDDAPETPAGATPGLVYRAAGEDSAWGIAATAIGAGARFGTVAVQVENRRWTQSSDQLPAWVETPTTLPAGEVHITIN